MQNPVPEAPSERPDRQDADHPDVSRSRAEAAGSSNVTASSVVPEPVVEIDGPSGPEPTRYGDWERKGRCIDF
ncbi:MAG: DUF1674 domain-containing protein [Sinobacteraceae bacterium]|nr:DUF1674 domain-containing protein [Nevskiaceae bacterium]MCP5339672.1 DUF1674 domain-containing protein [Nevskiaceae bacterium]MCP5360675.1 DUF1674 domain-containing protein [Nevskiaceae bacterium]